MYNGGYVMLDLADSKVLDRAKGLVNSTKPILVYSEGNLPVFANSISQADNVVTVVTPLGTYTISADGVVTA